MLLRIERHQKYREILIGPVRECMNYAPKFGHKGSGGFTLTEFQRLYEADLFYRWMGLDHPLMYSAHKAAGGITSVYRQIGIGSERLVRAIFMDYLELSNADVKWSYTAAAPNGRTRKLSLDGRIPLEGIKALGAKQRIQDWMQAVSTELSLAPAVKTAMTGIVFEVRQGYKSKDSKRQNADISNAANAYANGYVPCLMIMSAQIDDDVAARYLLSKWALLRGNASLNPIDSTYAFFEDVIGFDFADFMTKNQSYFQDQIHAVLQHLMRAE